MNSIFERELRFDLYNNILPYWESKMIDPKGGFYGRRDGMDTLVVDSPKGAILNARVLWTFAAAYRTTADKRWLATAMRAFDYIKNHFIDNKFGGVYWAVDSEGEPLDTKKQFYAIAFTIYGLAELVRATGSEEALGLALQLFRTIELHSRDYSSNGYVEATTRNWQPIADMRLSDKDENAALTMNTHLHIIEAYTNLLRVAPDNTELREAARNLLEIFLEKIIDPSTHHLRLFFNSDWTPTDSTVSYGHDIEASWLLLETAIQLGDDDLLRSTRLETALVAQAAMEGMMEDGSIAYERHPDGTLDLERHWWVQAEAVVGQLYQWRHHKKEDALEGALKTWEYIKANLVDSEAGEWFWSRLANGEVNRVDDHAGFWKCPYHNGRMAMEALSLIR